MNDQPSLWYEPAPPEAARPRSSRLLTSALRGLIDAAEPVAEGVPELQRAIAEARASLLASPKYHSGAGDTEIEAAAAHNTPSGGPTQRRVYDIFVLHREMTDSNLLYLFTLRHGMVSESSPRTRRRELVDLGVLRDSGKRLAAQGSRPQAVWELTGSPPPWLSR